GTGLGIFIVRAKVELEVLPGAERGACSSQHHDLGFIVLGYLVECLVHVEVKLRAHCIALLGPVHDHKRDAAVMLEFHGLISAEPAHRVVSRLAERNVVSDYGKPFLRADAGGRKRLADMPQLLCLQERQLVRVVYGRQSRWAWSAFMPA